MTVSRPGGVQVVIQQSAYSGLTVGQGLGIGEGAGMFPDQVMQAVASPHGLGQQVVIKETLEVAAGVCQPDAIQGSHGIPIDLSTRMQAQPPKCSLLLFGEILI